MSIIFNWFESLVDEITMSESCSHHRLNSSSCDCCVLACEKKALKISENGISVNPDLCNGCGDCVVACPLEAIKGPEPTRNIQKHMLIDGGDQAPTVKELLIYRSYGIDTVISAGNMQHSWLDKIKTANAMLETPFQIYENYNLKEEFVVSRRELLAVAFSNGKKIVREFLPVDWKTTEGKWRLNARYSDHQTHELLLNKETCTVCGGCERICPKGVIRIDENFRIRNSACVGCKMCADICPEKSIEIKEEWARAKEETNPIHTLTCSKCGEEFSSMHKEKQLCMCCLKFGHLRGV